MVPSFESWRVLQVNYTFYAVECWGDPATTGIAKGLV
jgi:hypothetical protein